MYPGMAKTARDEGHGRGCGGERHDIPVYRWGRVPGVQRPQGQAVTLAEMVAGGGSGGGVQVRGHPKRGGFSKSGCRCGIDV